MIECFFLQKRDFITFVVHRGGLLGRGSSPSMTVTSFELRSTSLSPRQIQSMMPRSTPSLPPRADAEPVAVSTEASDTLLECIAWICERHGVPRSTDALAAGLPRNGRLEPSLALIALRNAGFSAATVARDVRLLAEPLLPVILLRQDKGGAILVSRRDRPGEDQQDRERRKRGSTKIESGPIYQVIFPELGPVPVEVGQAELDGWYAGHAILVKPRAVVDVRAGEEALLGAGHWLLSVLWRYRRYYRNGTGIALQSDGVSTQVADGVTSHAFC